MPCGTVKGYTKYCYAVCDVGDHSAYCLGYNDYFNTGRETCPAGNHTRYCIGYQDGADRLDLVQKQSDTLNAIEHFSNECLAGHTQEYCDGYFLGFKDQFDRPFSSPKQ